MNIISSKQYDTAELTDCTVITDQESERKHITLNERLKAFVGEYTYNEADTGEPKGQEI